MTEPLEITMKIQFNLEAFDNLPDHTRETFMILINSELENMASILEKKTSYWMVDLRRELYDKRNGN